MFPGQQQARNTFIFGASGRPNDAWLGTDLGLVHVTDNAVTVVNGDMPAHTHVLAVNKDRDGTIWMGTDKGLGRKINDRISLYGPNAGIPSTEIFQILPDGHGNIWAGSSSGIFSVRISDLQMFDEGRLKSIPVVSYDSADGVPPHTNTSSVVRSHDGSLWLAGAQGMISKIDTLHIKTDSVPPRVAILSAHANDQELSKRNPNRIRPGQGSLRVDFTAFSFAAPERIRFRYRLLGLNSDWSEPSNIRSATYSSLPPGAYSFQVIACNSDGVWNEAGASIPFEIEPHLYQTWLFKTLCWLAGGVIILLFIKIRTRRLVLQTAMLEQQVELRTADLLKANEALSNAREVLAEANAQLASIAMTDGLTGIANRRSFQERLQEEWERHRRYLTPLSLVILDVDNFKKYNDTFGHPEGDTVLQNVASILSDNVRPMDFVARYGGEEFVVILPETDRTGAVTLTQRLHDAIESADWPLRSVTASFGVATAGHVERYQDLLTVADDALYKSKSNGRNCITFGENTQSQCVH